MITKSALLLTLFGLSACATSAVPLAEAKIAPPEKVLAFQAETPLTTSKLIAIRDAGYTGSACNLALYVDSVLAARLMPKQTAQFYLEPGEHLIRASVDPQGGGLCSLGDKNIGQTTETILRANETKVFRLSIDASGSVQVQRSEP